MAERNCTGLAAGGFGPIQRVDSVPSKGAGGSTAGGVVPVVRRTEVFRQAILSNCPNRARGFQVLHERRIRSILAWLFLLSVLNEWSH